MFQQKICVVRPRGISRLHCSREQKEACFKTRKDTILSTGYFMFLDTVEAHVVLTNNWLTAHFFLRAMTFGDGNMNTLASFQKHPKPIWDFKFLHMELTYKLFIWLFSPDVHGALASEKHTKQSAVYCDVSRVQSLLRRSVCSEEWSFKVTAVSQMSTELHVKKM